jgi:geranylgeranyl pyrophosphate synthase
MNVWFVKRMLRKIDPNQKKLTAMLEKRSREVLERFSQEAVSGFGYPKLVSMVEDVKAYWKDIQRPALTSFSCEAVGGQPSMADDGSLMITLAAAGMGIHDDIIDKSENKHFRETILGRYGLDNALLVGDLLIIKGLSHSRKFFGKKCSLKKREAVLEAFQNFVFEIYEGELMDISCRKNLDTDLEYYCKIMWKLTADAEACARIGAILGGGSERAIQALAEFGRRLGFVIHLGEELRDAFNVEGGLPHRLEYESVPFPILYAAKSSKEAFFEVKSMIEKVPDAALVSELMKLCWKSKAVNYVHNLAKKNASEALQKLSSLRPSSAREALALMIRVPLAYIKGEHYIENRYLKLNG